MYREGRRGKRDVNGEEGVDGEMGWMEMGWMEKSGEEGGAELQFTMITQAT